MVRHLHCGIVLAACLSASAANAAELVNGWTDVKQFLVASDGTRSLGDTSADFNATRDRGSKIVFFNKASGDNATAQVYWWDGSRIIDAAGSPAAAGGLAYGTDPLNPNEAAIKPFRYPIGLVGNADGDGRLRTHGRSRYPVAESYPDWLLFRRGQTHDTFDGSIDGGRSEQAPMVIAAYGPAVDGRAVIDAATGTQVNFRGGQRPIVEPFSSITSGDSAVWFHKVMVGLQLTSDMAYLGTHNTPSLSGGVPSLLVEDCKLVNASLVYMPIHTTVRRSVSAFRWLATAHNQGYYNSDFDAAATFEEVIFYRNGYKSDPLVDPDPRRDIFSRNFYQGGGAQMGHTYRNIISADGASGGPQMRLGALCENSLIIEGYWFSSTNSNSATNTWLTSGNQTGRSAIVRNNVQFVFAYPTPRDPDTDTASDSRAQPGWGYTLQGASFGATIEDNIVSHAMLSDDLGRPDAYSGAGYTLNPNRDQYQDGGTYTQQNDTIRGNIAWRMRSGLALQDDWTGVSGSMMEDNVLVAGEPVSSSAANLTSAGQLTVRNNRFYANGALPNGSWVGAGNTVSPYAQAAQTEGWPDPNRTLKRYVTEVLHLDLLDWQDEPGLDQAAVAVRATAGEAYDPMGLKTFMAVATNMRYGGTQPIPSSGKPSWRGDYPWDQRFTGLAVVNWIREGFGKAPIIAARPWGVALPSQAREHRLWTRTTAGSGAGICFVAAPGERVRVTIHDLRGRVVRDFGEAVGTGAVSVVRWDGSNAAGAPAAPGTCVAVLRSADGRRLASAVVPVR